MVLQRYIYTNLRNFSYKQGLGILINRKQIFKIQTIKITASFKFETRSQMKVVYNIPSKGIETIFL